MKEPAAQTSLLHEGACRTREPAAQGSLPNEGACRTKEGHMKGGWALHVYLGALSPGWRPVCTRPSMGECVLQATYWLA